jgi:hypothetical protein
MKVKRSFIAENQISRETVFLQVMLHFGTELQTKGFVVKD